MAEKINVEIVTAYDDKKAKEAIKDAEKIDKLDPELEISADDQASDVLADVTDAAKETDKLDPEVTVSVDDKASDDLSQIGEKTQALSREDAEIVVRAQVDAARADLDRLEAKLHEVQEQSEDTNRQLDKTTGGGGGGVRGNAIADLTGPLGEASSAASDFAGVFDGIGDIAEDVAGKIGLSEGATASLVGAIGGIGVAVAAGAAAWSYFKGKQEEARRKQAELTKATEDYFDALKQGDLESAARKLREMYDDGFEAAKRAKVGAKDYADFLLTGHSAAVDTAREKLQEYDALLQDHTHHTSDELAQIQLARNEYQGFIDTMDGGRNTYLETNGALSDQNSELSGVESALRGADTATGKLSRSQQQVERDLRNTAATLEHLQEGLDIEQAMLDFQDKFAAAANTVDETMAESEQDVLDFKQFVLDTGTELGRTPVEINTVLNKVDQGDLYGAKADVQTWFDQNPVFITIGGVNIRLSAQQRALFGNTIIPGLGTPQMAPPSPPTVTPPIAAGGGNTTVNVNMPVGSRGVDVLRQVSGQSRRSGRRYGVPVVHFASRHPRVGRP